jgi:general secretion pathway protein A
MHEQFYGHFGLRYNPFHVSPNPQRYYSTTAHDEALLHIMFGIESRKGLMVLTGEPGTGKTTILHYLLEWLGRNNYSTAYVFHTILTSSDLLHIILRDFGVKCASNEKSEMLIAFREWLLHRRRAGDCPVIIIDEAQALTSRALEELRMLLNLEIFGVKLVQLVLAGQPRLEARLHRKRLTQLRERIMCHCKLPALTLPETTGYIEKRVTDAGAHNPELFPLETIEEIYKYSRGIPRVIHLLCDQTLLAACADRRDTICTEDVLRIAQQFDLQPTYAPAEEEVFRPNTFRRLMAFPRLEAMKTAIREHDREMERKSVLQPIAVAAPVMEEIAEAEIQPMAVNASAVQSFEVHAGPSPETLVKRLEKYPELVAELKSGNGNGNGHTQVVYLNEAEATVEEMAVPEAKPEPEVMVARAAVGAQSPIVQAQKRPESANVFALPKPAVTEPQDRELRFPMNLADSLVSATDSVTAAASRKLAALKKEIASTMVSAAPHDREPRVAAQPLKKWPVAAPAAAVPSKLPAESVAKKWPIEAVPAVQKPVQVEVKAVEPKPLVAKLVEAVAVETKVVEPKKDIAPAPPMVIAKTTDVSRSAEPSGFALYWQGVGRSLAHDARAFTEPFGKWLRGPMPKTDTRRPPASSPAKQNS